MSRQSQIELKYKYMYQDITEKTPPKTGLIYFNVTTKKMYNNGSSWSY